MVHSLNFRKAVFCTYTTTGDVILSCTGLRDKTNYKITQSLFYDMLFIGKSSEMAEVAKALMQKLKVRDKILEEPD